MWKPRKGEFSKLDTIMYYNAPRFLYSLFIAMDVNFQLKNCARSSDNSDPGLHTGLAYFVANPPYHDYLLRFATQNDVRLLSIND